VSEWRSIVGLTEVQVSDIIHKDQIDILVELTGHTANNRLDVLCCKPAPIKVTWIGYPNTTGLSTIDYRITDKYVDPLDTEQPYVESLLRTPNCFLSYTPSPEAPDVINSPPAIENGFITFGSFNNLAKIGNKVIALWSRILKSVPNSRLLVKAKPFANSEIQQKFTASFEKEGISSNRLDLLSLIPSCSEHLRAYGLIDIALDTFPYAGTTTSCEALFMGVPVVVLRGKSNHAHNVGVSLLYNIGLCELIAESPNDCVRISVELASDLPRLRDYRKTIRPKMLASPLCDGITFTKDLESIYIDIFTKWCNDQKEKNSNNNKNPTEVKKSNDFTTTKSSKEEDKEENKVEEEEYLEENDEVVSSNDVINTNYKNEEKKSITTATTEEQQQQSPLIDDWQRKDFCGEGKEEEP